MPLPWSPLVLHSVPTQCNGLLQVADQLGCSRRALKVATPEQCCSVFGYMPGKQHAHVLACLCMLEHSQRHTATHSERHTVKDNMSLSRPYISALQRNFSFVCLCVPPAPFHVVLLVPALHALYVFQKQSSACLEQHVCASFAKKGS